MILALISPLPAWAYSAPGLEDSTSQLAEEASPSRFVLSQAAELKVFGVMDAARFEVDGAIQEIGEEEMISLRER